jgi:hypothetical protein
MTFLIIGAGAIALWLALKKVSPTAAPSSQAAQDGNLQATAPTASTSYAPTPQLANPTGGSASQVTQVGTVTSADSIVHVNQYLNWEGTGGGPLKVLSVGNGPLLLKLFLALNVTGSPETGFGATIGNRVSVPDGTILRDLPTGKELVVREGRIKSS